MTDSDSTNGNLPELSGGKPQRSVPMAKVLLPDYELLRDIGAGAFGEVWLARSKATGRYRAIKIVYRERLPDQAAYEVEFAGLKKFEKVSREHLGFIDILHISRHDSAGYFYYVMELSDDIETGQQIAESSYISKTLATELNKRGRLPIPQCVEVGLTLAEALAQLHQHGLVHRDIKPTNIVFVRGDPKLADIGLVTEANPTAESLLRGTLHYMDPHVHGTIQGDIYSLGKILYVMATGRRAAEWPARPEHIVPSPDFEDFCDLEQIFLKACHQDVTQRYANAKQIREALLPLRISASLRRLQKWTQFLAAAKRYALLAVMLLTLAVVAIYQWRAKLRHERELHDRLAGSYVAYGTRAMENLDALGSLPWFAEALRLDHKIQANAQTHRLRLGSVLRNAPTIVQMWFCDWDADYAAFAGQEDKVLVPNSDGRWGIHDLRSGLRTQPPFGQGKWGNVSISTNADLALLAGETNYLRRWRLSTGEELSRLTYTNILSFPALSADGQWAAAAAEDYSVLLWNLSVPGPPQVLKGPTGEIYHLCFSHDGTRLASAGAEPRVMLWDTATGMLSTNLIQHTKWVYSVCFSPDDKLLATSSFDRSARIWDTQTGAQLPSCFWHDDAVYSIEFSADGERVITACLDFTVRIWERSTGRLLQQLRHDTRPLYAAFSPEGRHVVTATHDGTIRVWDLRLGGELQDMPGVMAIAEDGKHLVHTNRQLVLSEIGKANADHTILTQGAQWLKVLVSDHADRMVIISELPSPAPTHEATAILWDSRTLHASSLPLSLPIPLPELILSPGGDRLVVLDTNLNQVTLWDLDLKSVLLTNQWLGGPAAFDASGRKLAIASSNLLSIWPLAAMPLKKNQVLPHSRPVESVVWSHNGRRLVTACRQTEKPFEAEAARIWDASTGQRVGTPLQHKDGVLFAAFSPDDRIVVSCGEDFVAMLWEAATGRLLAPPLLHKHQVLYAAFSENGRWLATACSDGTARVWDIRDVWNTRNVEPITPPLAHSGSVRFVQFLNGDTLLCARNEKNQFRIWELSPDDRPLEDLMMISELLSAQSIHITNGQAGASQIMRTTSKNGLRSTWERLHTNYPSEFGF